MRAVIQEVLAPTQAGRKLEHHATAESHRMKWRSLETLTRKYRQELIELGGPVEVEQKYEIEIRAEPERSLCMLAEYEKHLNGTFEPPASRNPPRNSQRGTSRFTSCLDFGYLGDYPDSYLASYLGSYPLDFLPDIPAVISGGRTAAGALKKCDR